MKIYLATISHLKKAALQDVLQELVNQRVIADTYQIMSHDIISKVPLTPLENETFSGAKQRAVHLYQQHPGIGSCYIGLESGLVTRYEILFEECWCFLLDNQGNEYVGYSSGYPIPQQIREHMKIGRGHIHILNQLADKLNIPQKDTWAIYTNNLIGRKTSIKEAFRNAFLSYVCHQH